MAEPPVGILLITEQGQLTAVIFDFTRAQHLRVPTREALMTILEGDPFHLGEPTLSDRVENKDLIWLLGRPTDQQDMIAGLLMALAEEVGFTIHIDSFAAPRGFVDEIRKMAPLTGRE